MQATSTNEHAANKRDLVHTLVIPLSKRPSLTTRRGTGLLAVHFPELELDDVVAYPQGNGDSWLRLRSKHNSKQEGEKPNGKYLFFSRSPQTLLALACSELKDHGFANAKVSVRPSGNSEHCLCLYWADDERAHQLQARHPQIKFRGYKTDAATRAGIYSREFLQTSQSPAEAKT